MRRPGEPIWNLLPCLALVVPLRRDLYRPSLIENSFDVQSNEPVTLSRRRRAELYEAVVE